MGDKKLQPWAAFAWELADRQHGVISRRQLLELGLSSDAIAHRLARGRLHQLHRGIYAVGRPKVSLHGKWMAAVLACGPEALLSHRSAAALWGLIDQRGAIVDVTVPATALRRRPGIRAHRRGPPLPRAEHEGVPVLSVAATLLDLAADDDPRLESAVNAADRLDRLDPERFGWSSMPIHIGQVARGWCGCWIAGPSRRPIRSWSAGSWRSFSKPDCRSP